MPFSLNMKAVAEQMKPFKADGCPFKIGKVESFVSKDKGTPCLRTELVCMQEGDNKDKRVYDIFTLDGKSNWKLAQLIAALGLATYEEETEFNDEYFADVVKNEAWFGREVYCDTDVSFNQKNIDSRTGQPYPPKTEIVKYWPAGEGLNL